MELTAFVCPKCGARLDVKPESEMITCEFCGTVCAVDDGKLHIVYHFENAKQAGREFEEGREQYRREQEERRKAELELARKQAEARASEENASGCLLAFVAVIMIWLAFVTFCGFKK